MTSYRALGNTGFSHTRPAPFGSPPSHRADSDQLDALEQLLRTIAQRAQSMSAQEILALNAAFSVTGSSSSSSSSSITATPENPDMSQNFSQDPYNNRRQKPLVQTGVASATGQGMVTAPVDVYQELSPPQQLMPNMSQQESVGPLPTLEEVGGGLNTVKVSARANVKSVAGALSKSLRSHDMLVATAVGPEGTNHGMKALSIARCYLAAEGLDLSATVVEVQPDSSVNGQGRCYAFVVVRIVVPAKTGEPLCEAGVGRTEPMPRFVRPEGHQTDMKVSGSGNACTLGGAIAKCLREDREVVITAVGPAAVAKCVEAMALARSYVWNDGLQLAFFPGFEHIIMQGVGPGAGEQRSCVRVHVWPEVAHQDDSLTAGFGEV